jgi:hypothetical protein
MAKYGVSFDAFATTTSAKTAMGVFANGTGEIFEAIEAVMTGSGTTAAADTQHRAMIAKCTFGATGTATTQTADPFNDKANASVILCLAECSAEPTTVGTVFPVLFGFNQRGGMRWSVPQGEGITCANANTNKGIVLQVISSAAGAVDGHLHYHEP